MRAVPFFLLAATLGAQAPAQVHETAQVPAIAVDQPHFDFGRITTEAKVVHRFRISNKGTAALNISRLNPSCGCTSTVIGQWTLNPGQSTEVEATFNPAGFRGTIHKSIQVVSNDPRNPTLNLTFEAEVLREITPSSDSVFFQDLVRTVPRKSSIKFTSGTGQAFKLLEAKAPGAPYLAASLRSEADGTWWVDLQMDGKLVPPGRTVGTDAVVVHTDNARLPMINLTVQWEMRTSLVADPVRVAWVEPAGKELKTKVTLRQVDGKPFRIVSTRTSNSLLRVEGVPKVPGAQQEFQVVLDAKAKPGSYTEKIILATDNPDQPELELRVAASLR